VTEAGYEPDSQAAEEAPSTAIIRENVDSSLIFAIGYDPTTETLAVEFHARKDGSRPVYTYSPVSADLYADLRAAESLGREFTARVKNAGIPFRLVETVAG
jgi:hypothetical protein